MATVDATRAAHRAVAALFLVNAAAYANVVPRLPAVKAELGLSNTSLGSAVAAMPVGALLAGPAAGWLVARVGSGPLAVACGVGFGIVLPGFALSPGWAGLAAVFLVLGALDSLMDVSMNAHALRVQRLARRSIIHALHGVWSIGAVAGAGAGALAVAAGLGLGAHLALAGAVVATLSLAARGWLLTGPDEPDEPAEAPTTAAPAGAGGHRLLLLGCVVLLSAVVEDAPQSWGAVYLREDVGTAAAAAGFVYLAFQAAMTAGRLVGDRAIDRFGVQRVVRAGGLLTAGAVAAGLALGSAPAAIAGFGLAGLGTAALFPAVFHAAGEVPGLPTGHGVAVVAWTGRVGFLVAPVVVGLIGDAAGLRAGLLVVPAAGFAVALLAGRAFERSGTVVDRAR